MTAHATPQRATLIWLFLLAATAVAWWLGETGAAGPAIFAMLFGFALVKGALILLDYMALRHAPLLWRALTLGWLIAVIALIALAYWRGLTP
ncbi:cytochrome C oxidase subunit IV family protein [Pseudazoarcus pumilus]|uniref:Cytochrome C oxidase subunit IV n=1 Tax=Pseudazoarcus pumilus TaxID=2067960 RepID=A0A2I6S791_9RHOO|nr:cytochrome C oxidase subunit IV family protein [Pseudazoarcus pumilus]AUN95115.1 hypothetical protein C0099_09300 [Pseudazoarcus pumilus]